MTAELLHANMCDVKDAARAARLRKKARAFRRAKAALEEKRLDLREEILDAAAAKERPADIIREIEHTYDVAHVSRMIHGKA